MIGNEKYEALRDFLIDGSELSLALERACKRYNSDNKKSPFDELKERVSAFISETDTNRFAEPFVADTNKLRTYISERTGWVIYNLQERINLHNKNILSRGRDKADFNIVAAGLLETEKQRVIRCRKDILNQIKSMENKEMEKEQFVTPGNLELTEKLLIVAYLQIAGLFPKYDYKGLFTQTAMYELIGKLLSEKPNTVKKSFNERVSKIVENKGINPRNRKQRLEYLQKVKEILSSLHNEKINREIDSTIKKVQTEKQKV